MGKLIHFFSPLFEVFAGAAAPVFEIVYKFRVGSQLHSIFDCPIAFPCISTILPSRMPLRSHPLICITLKCIDSQN